MIQNILNNKKLYWLFLQENVNIIDNIKQYLALNNLDGFRIIVETFVQLEKGPNKFSRKKFYKVYEKFCKMFSKELLKELFNNIVHTAINFNFKNNEIENVSLPSHTFIRKTILLNPAFKYYKSFRYTSYTNKQIKLPFNYTNISTSIKQINMPNSSWYFLLKTLNYRSIVEKIIIKQLIYIKRITQTHSEGHLLYFLISDYYQKNKELLF
jgi:hypothetical protein